MGKSTLERYLEKKKLKEEEEKERDKTSSKIPLPSLSEARLSVSADKLHIPESMREKSDLFSVSSTEKGTLERYRTKKSSQEVTAKLKTWYDEYSSYVSDYQSRTAGLTGTYNDSYSSGTSEWLADLTTRKNHLDKEADEIRGLLEITREVYGDKWTDAALVGLDMGRKTQEEILGGASSYNKYWSQWESEDKYNEWATYMRDREEKLSYDLEAGAREIALLENRLATIPLVKRPFSPIYEELNSKKAYYNLAEQLQTYESLKEQAISSPHFKSYAALGESDPRNINITKGVKDDKYAGRYQGVAQFAANEDWLDHLTDEQREIYNYHVFADSQNGTNNAEQFLDLVEKGAQSAMYNKAYEKFDDSALGAVFYNAAANVVSAFTGIEAFLSEDGSARHSGLTESIAVASENESLKDIDLKYYNIIDKEWKDTDILGKSLGQVASEGVGTVAHMLPSVLASSLASFIGGPTVGRTVGSVMLGLSAAGAGKQQMLDLGYSKEQATAYGALVGASETLLEYAFSGISAIGGKAWDALGKTKLLSKLDNVLGNISVKAPSALVALGKTVGGMAGEAFEEGLQTIIEPWLESVVLGGDYEAPDWEEVAYSSLLGALSAAGLEGIGASVNVRRTAKTGREIQNIEGGIQKLIDTGHSYTVDTVAHKLAGKIEAAINEGKKVNAYSIGKLFIEEGATLSEQNKNDIKRGLAEMNWDENSANVMTETYARFLDESIELSQEAIDIFTENAPFTRAVVNKLIGENTTAYQRQKGYVDLERMVNGETSVKASAKTETKTTPEFDDATVEAIKRVKADIESDRSLLSADRSRKIAAEANKASAEDLARNALKVEGKYNSHGTGVTRLKDTHEKVSITDVVSVKDGNVRVRLNNNKVVDLAELDLASESDAVLYEAVARMGVDAGAAKLIVNGYDAGSGVSAEAYALGMAEAINNGKYNIKQISSNGFAAMLNPIQQKLGRDIGRMSAEATARAEQDAINARVAKAKAEGKPKQVGGISYDASVDTESLNDTQKTQISVLEKVMPSLGVKVKLFASSVANEGGKRGFTTEDGQFTRANGWYDPETGEIWVDVNAGADGKGLILVTAAHELTHFIRQWSPAKYKIFADFIISQYGEGSKTVNELVKERQDVAVERGYTLSYDEALEEVVARSCESFLQDSEAAVKIAALAQKDKSLAQKVKSFVGQLLAKIRRAAKELGLAPDSEEGKYIASMETGLQSLYDMWTDALIDAGRSFSRAGVAVDGNTESASPAFSERTWSASEYVTERDAAARKLAESLGVSIAKAKKYIDNVNSIAKVIANDRVRLDYEASSFGSAFVSNVEYGGSFDYTTLCKKRRIYTGTFQEIQKRIGDEVLSPDDILEIRNMMIEGGIEATCGLCYVEGSRANMGKFAKEFIKLYKRDNPDGWTPTMVDVNTPDGVEQMRINHPEAYDQYQYFWDHYGKLKDTDKALFASQQKPKLYEARKEYKGEILQHFKNVDTIAKKNRNGGIRMQSFSDFEIVHLIDTMQVIMDMSQVGLAGQAYTKVPEFAEAFGNTGLKINLSLIAKDVDANGNLVFDNREGMPAETAFKLRDKYSANVGTIIVTFTDEQLYAAMADPRIDFIIPFHRSQWKKSQYGAMGLPKGTKDYTYMQNEKLIKPTYHEFRGRMVKDKASNYMPNEYWDFSKSGKENAEAYLEMCAAENKRPKFYKLLDYDGNGKYSLKKDGSTDGYWKLLIDFKMYDNDGAGSPQMPVAPDFSMDEAMTMLDEYKGGHQSYPIAHGVVDKFVEKYNTSNRRQFSERDSDYMDAVNRGDIEAAQRMVDEAAKEWGAITNGNTRVPKPRHLYHGSGTFGFTRFHDGRIYATAAESVAAGYNRGRGLGRVRSSSLGYIPNDGTVETAIKNAKNVLGAKLTKLDDVAKQNIISKADNILKEVATKVAELDEFTDYGKAGEFFEYLAEKYGEDKAIQWTNHLDSLHYMLAAEYTTEEIMEDGEWLIHDLKKYHEWKQSLSELWSEERDAIKDATLDKVFMYLLGYEYGDALIDIEYGLGRLLDNRPKLVNANGSLVYLEDIIDGVEMAKDTGIYDLYGHPGEKPLIIDEGKRFWDAIPFENGFRSTDYIVKWAKEHGYTSVLFKTVLDPSSGGSANIYADEWVFFDSNQVKSADPVTYDDNGNVIPLSQRFDSNNPDIRYSDREEKITEREILADTLMGAAANDIEKNKLKAYKAKVKEMEAEQEKLGKIKAQIKELSFAKGKRDTEKIKRLRELAVKTENRINIYDRQLLSLEATKPMRDLLERRVAEVGARERAKATEKAKAQLSAVREQRDRKLAQQKVKSREQVEAMRASGIRTKIKKIRADIESTLLHPTDGKYIPVPLGRAMIEVCDLIDIDTPLVKKDGTPNAAQEKRDRTKARLSELAAEYENLKHNEDQMLVSEHDEQIDAYLKDLRNRYDDVSLNEMSYEELKYFHDVLKSIMGTLRDARKVIGKNDARTLYEYGDAIIEEQKKIKETRGERGKFQKQNDKFVNLSLSPLRNVERMSGYNDKSALVEITRDFEEGVRRKNLFEMRAKKTFEALTAGNNEKAYHDAIYRDFGGKKYVDSKGKKFGISKMQMMQAILSYEREQANPNQRHISNGGFTFADLDLLNKGEIGEAISAENSHSIFGGYALVTEFIEKLAGDKWAQDYMQASREFFNGMAKDAINDTYLLLKHRILARDKNYIPYEVDKRYVVREITGMDALQQTISSYGMLQETVKNASQPLIITGLNNMLDRHIDQVGSVYGLAIPIRNFNKIWNISEKGAEGDATPKQLVKGAIEENWGADGQKSIEQMVIDLQSNRRHERSKIERAIESGYIGATFALNLSVVSKQIGSLYTANSMLDKSHSSIAMLTNLANTMIHFKKLSAEVDKYTAAVYNRREGLSNQEIYTLATQAKRSRIARALNQLPAVINPSKWITFMDASVALSLWKYVKADVKKSTNLEDEALLEATAKRFNDVIENTQSMNDVLHRPEIQKRGDLLSRGFSVFKTDLYQSAGLLRVGIGRYSANGSKENAKALRRTVASIAKSALWGSLMTTFFALIRYKVNPYRDDEEELTAESWLKRQGIQLMGDLVGYLMPIAGGEIVGFAENVLFGETDELIDNIAISAANDVYDAILTVADAVREGEMPDAKEWDNLFVKAATAFGVPASNIKRTVTAIKLHAEDIANGEFFSFEAGAKKSNTQKLYNAVMRGDTKAIAEVEELFKNASAVESARKQGLRDNDKRIKVAALALYSGDTRGFGEYIKEIAAEGNFDSETVEAAVRAEASAYETKIEGAWVALEDGDQEAYKDLVRDLRKAYKGILSQDEIVEAVSEYEKPAEEAEDGFEEVESIYKTSDINTALESGDTDHALEIVKEMLEVKTENNLTKARLEAEKSGKRFVEKKALKEAQTAANASVRSSLTSYWKKRYLEAFEAKDYAETERIRRLLHSTGVYGKLSELDADLKEWRKNN